MALLIAYTLHDVKALTYSPPFFTSNDAIAKRMVSDLVADTNTTVGRHPADYKLYKIGTFDEGNAVLTPLSIPEHVADCISFVPPPKPSMFDTLSMGTTIDPQKFADWMSKANGEAK